MTKFDKRRRNPGCKKALRRWRAQMHAISPSKLMATRANMLAKPILRIGMNRVLDLANDLMNQKAD
ncbi:hypothetical protein [Caballeronia ptereochthonis]|uniref:Uncharacterized protein n=1 Tax=Caballeronia ptereochthonis TaxID=1777144 RepID=A0A158AGM1_9BURK|nr:hypothetical protein [Caballeronia ptereochthonis]SAK56962.1 hypothetical protein AWB83_01818 [Caballeronia ptereochthonis]